ncbi:O-antigen translocase [Roseinatronobacter sp.]
MTREPLNAVKAVSVIGSAKVLSIAFGLVKMKVAAVLLGPAGVGLIGLFQQLTGTVSTLFGMGLDKSGTRQIANARVSHSERKLATVRRALFWGTICLALAGAVFLFLARDLVATHLLRAPLQRAELGWLAVGVALTVGAASQQALLNGLRQIRELAQITVLTGAVSAVIAIGAMVLWREYAVIVFVLASPLASFVLGHVFVARLPQTEVRPSPARDVAAEFTTMLRLGSTIMLAALVVAAGHLAVRTLIQRELGAEALGLFTAAWLISQYYIGFLYTAITMDYYPRLTAAMGNKQEACRIINEQTEIGLLFAAPLFLGMMALAPYAMLLLYSKEFMPATDTLRWFILGDILKTVAHPLGFALLAAGAGWTYFYARLFGIAVFIVAVAVLMPRLGTAGAGIAYLMMYVVYLPVVLFLVRRSIPLNWEWRVLGTLLATAALSVLVAVLAQSSERLAALSGLIAAAVLAVVAMRRLRVLWRKKSIGKKLS